MATPGYAQGFVFSKKSGHLALASGKIGPLWRCVGNGQPANPSLSSSFGWLILQHPSLPRTFLTAIILVGWSSKPRPPATHHLLTNASHHLAPATPHRFHERFSRRCRCHLADSGEAPATSITSTNASHIRRASHHSTVSPPAKPITSTNAFSPVTPRETNAAAYPATPITSNNEAALATLQHP